MFKVLEKKVNLGFYTQKNILQKMRQKYYFRQKPREFITRRSIFTSFPKIQNCIDKFDALYFPCPILPSMVLKENNFEPRIPHPAKLLTKHEGNIKSLSNRPGLRNLTSQALFLK